MIVYMIGIMGCTTLPNQNFPTQSSPPSIQTTPIPASAKGDVIQYAVFPAPPYMIGAGDENSAMSGIDVEIVQEIARRMNLKVEYIKCTWSRCLELMKTGEADLLSSAYKKPDREEYMLYLSQPFLNQLPVAFYFIKGKNYSVTTYDDIYQFGNIGVLNGASYFERFDQDKETKKFEVTSQDQLFPMLLAGRLDAIAGYVPTENYRITEGWYRDQIERSVYEYQEQAFVYMTISKESPLAARFDQINQINQQLLDKDFIAKIVNSYIWKVPLSSLRPD
jgi:polar amino acid transport system substrate-binding protein